MPDMPARTVFVIAQGPPDEIDHARAVLQNERIASHPSERGPNLIEAWFDSEDEWPPHPATECDLFSRVIEALVDTNFVAVEWGRQETSAWTSAVAMDRVTGRALGFILDTTQPIPLQAVALADWLEVQGIRASEIEWRPAAPFNPPRPQRE